jgi:hypothetical protein
MKTETQYVYTKEQFKTLTKSEKTAILCLMDYVTGEKWSAVNDQILSRALNIWRPTKGCVPEDEFKDNLAEAVHYKYSALFNSAVMAAEDELAARGITLTDDNALKVIIDASCDDTTHVAVIQLVPPICYEHHQSKAWLFHFSELKDLAQEFLRIKGNLVDKVLERHQQQSHTIHVVVAAGLVQEVRDIPPGLEVKVIDYDIETVEDFDLQISPLDGAACSIRTFHAEPGAMKQVPV